MQNYSVKMLAFYTLTGLANKIQTIKMKLNVYQTQYLSK